MSNPIDLLPLRLHPGDDLRSALMQRVSEHGAGPAFVVAGIGSLVQARLRFAGEANETIIGGPIEILTMSGTVSSAGIHMHIAVSDAQGRVLGGHAGPGNIVRTTVEALLVFLPAWNLTRQFDPATGFDELDVRPS